jgi:hypothetical protein
MEWLRRRPLHHLGSSSFQVLRPPRSIPAHLFRRRRLGLTRMALHRQSLQRPMLCHPQTARQFGAAVCAVVLGSRAAYRHNSTRTSTTRPASVTLIHGRPAPRCTSLPMRFHLQSTIPVLTHERSTRVQLVHIRGDRKFACWGKARSSKRVTVRRGECDEARWISL